MIRIRAGLVSIDEIREQYEHSRELVEKQHVHHTYFDYKPGIAYQLESLKIQCFMENGCKCEHCGLQGAYFAVESAQINKHKKRDLRTRAWLETGNPSSTLNLNAMNTKGVINWCVNLYAIDNDGNEVIMTRDHIVPRSKCGRDSLRNLQTLCGWCNVAKDDVLPDLPFMDMLNMVKVSARDEFAHLYAMEMAALHPLNANSMSPTA